MPQQKIILFIQILFNKLCCIRKVIQIFHWRHYCGSNIPVIRSQTQSSNCIDILTFLKSISQILYYTVIFAYRNRINCRGIIKCFFCTSCRMSSYQRYKRFRIQLLYFLCKIHITFYRRCACIKYEQRMFIFIPLDNL